jgi:hypothetical protein
MGRVSVSHEAAMAIFTQPKNLEFLLTERSNARWDFLITRGPRDTFQPLIYGRPIFRNQDAAVKAINVLFRTICTAMTRELIRNDKISHLVNPQRLPIDDLTVLSGELRERICTDLHSQLRASTYNYE